jgi:hypothetical protein
MFLKYVFELSGKDRIYGDAEKGGMNIKECKINYKMDPYNNK